MEVNLANISLALKDHTGRLVDLGCGDGERTLAFARAARVTDPHGVDVTGPDLAVARARGIAVTEADLNGRLPFEDGSFDVVVSNQVIEHLNDTDTFVSECRRLLSDGGVCVCSTENLASWHNIAALAFGWQPFSLTNVSLERVGLGNPLAIHRDEDAGLRSWQHLRVFAYRGLQELFVAHGFRHVRVMGAGYYPLPARTGRRDPRHAAFLTVRAEV